MIDGTERGQVSCREALILIVLDTIAFLAIARILSGSNMMDQALRYLVCAFVLAIVGLILALNVANLAIVLIGYLITLLLIMRFGVGASWLGAFIGSGIFIGYRLLLSQIV